MTINVPSASWAPSTPRFTLHDSVDSENVKSCTCTHTHMNAAVHIEGLGGQRKCQVLCVFVCVYTHTHPHLLFLAVSNCLYIHTHSQKHILMCYVYINTHIPTNTHTHLCPCTHIHTSEATISILDRITKPEFRPSVAGNLIFFWCFWCSCSLIRFLVFLFFNMLFRCVPLVSGLLWTGKKKLHKYMGTCPLGAAQQHIESRVALSLYV